MSNYKAIDISKLNKRSIQKITYADLVSDAAARQDQAAYEFLRKINQENKDKPPRNRQRIQTIRTEYLRTFCGYGKPTLQPHPQLSNRFTTRPSLPGVTRWNTRKTRRPTC